MGSHITKPSNKSMVDRLVEHNSYIRSPSVEGVFRAVDRAMYFDLEEGDGIDPYEDDPWRRGNLHLSAPCIYAKVVEALDLRSGLSFLNLGSGTGYLNTIVGLLVGPNGLNHGIELHSDVIEYANNRLQQFKQHSYAIDKYNFAEPLFIMGNCLNLNPNSQYDRIYLGAACLPDLENFMKKLIKPNGGILVMPFENHLVRYIRITESEWRSEKLMDVNFTLMIRQGDNEPMIDMPLAQAKSLKELCRNNIRQQLRDKTNSLNPNLLHSDNISSRRMRKARAERRMLMREERSTKSKNRYFFGDRRRGSKDSDNSQSRKSKSKMNGVGADRNGGCGCRRYVEEIDEPAAMPSSGESLEPSTSSASARTRVMTRSASRRLEGRVASPPHTLEDPLSMSRLEQGNSSRDISPNKYHLTTSSSESGDSDNDNGQVHNSSRTRTTATTNTTTTISNNNYDANSSSIEQDGSNNNNCARTRPYVYTTRNPSRPSLYMPSAYRTAPSDRFITPSSLLPFHRRMARIIDPPSSSSSSSSESSDDLHELNEYDYIGRRVVLDWPGFLRIHDEGPADLAIPDEDDDDDDANSHSTDSTLSSHNSDLILGGDNDSVASDMSSWDSFYDSFQNNHDGVDLDELSSFLDSDNDDGTQYQDEVNEASVLTNTSPVQPSTSGRCQTRATSRLKDDRAKSKPASTTATKSAINSVVPPTMGGGEGRKAGDQEPVARRLRSKRAPSIFNPEDAADNLEAPSPMNLDRPVPSCSRNELQQDNCHKAKCPTHLRSSRLDLSSSSSSLSCKCHTTKSGVSRSKVSEREPETTNRNQDCSSSNRNQNNTTDGNHSPMRLSSETSFDLMNGNQPGQELFTGRVLIATALGTTLSLAAHHYHNHHHHHASSTSRNGSLGLFERNFIGNVAPTTRHGRPQQQQQQKSPSDRKRKRHSSSESGSDRSEESSSPSRAHRSGSRLRRRCECSRLVQTQLNSPSSSNLQTIGGGGIDTPNGAPVSGPNSEPPIDQQSSSSANKQQAKQVVAKANDRSRPNGSSDPSVCSSRHDRNPSAYDNGQIDNNDAGSNHQPGDPMNHRSGRGRHHNISSSSGSHHHHNQHRHHHRHHHNHDSHHSCRRSLETTTNKRSRAIDQQSNNVVKGEKKQHKRDRKRENECQRYHNYLSGYIRQLPLPRVLHGYLNYERNLAD